MKTRKVIYKVVLEFDDSGRVDTEALLENVAAAIQRWSEHGALTPDDEDHASLMGWRVARGESSVTTKVVTP